MQYREEVASYGRKGSEFLPIASHFIGSIAKKRRNHIERCQEAECQDRKSIHLYVPTDAAVGVAAAIPEPVYLFDDSSGDRLLYPSEIRAHVVFAQRFLRL